MGVPTIIATPYPGWWPMTAVRVWKRGGIVLSAPVRGGVVGGQGGGGRARVGKRAHLDCHGARCWRSRGSARLRQCASWLPTHQGSHRGPYRTILTRIRHIDYCANACKCAKQ